MTIDLGSWNEYIADDVPPGRIPWGEPLELMSILTWDGYRDPPADDIPTGVKCKADTIKTRTFWRIKEDGAAG